MKSEWWVLPGRTPVYARDAQRKTELRCVTSVAVLGVWALECRGLKEPHREKLNSGPRQFHWEVNALQE